MSEAKLNLNQSIIKIRVELQNAGLKKSGKNSHAGFQYFELSDFLPALNSLMEKYGINDILSIENDFISLELVKDDERNVYRMPFVLFETPIMKSGSKQMQDIQYLGALNTYYKRYLYMNAFGITDGDVIDSLNNDDLSSSRPQTQPQQQKSQAPKPTGEKVTKEVAEKYKAAVIEYAERRNITDGSVTKGFLERLGVANFTNITVNQIEYADEMVAKMVNDK